MVTDPAYSNHPTVNILGGAITEGKGDPLETLGGTYNGNNLHLLNGSLDRGTKCSYTQGLSRYTWCNKYPP